MIYLNDHLLDFDLNEALAELSEQRRQLALRYRHELGRRMCAAAYLLLCEGLRKEYGITEKPVFEFGEHGKPSIIGRPDIHFSLSHCREAAICVVSDRPVGIDVESVGRYSDTLARYTMNDRELEEIGRSDRPDIAFIRLWTMKEAVLKCTGEGIGRDLKNVLNQSPELTTVVSSDEKFVYSVCYAAANPV
ncbi:MAG: 4'-phosphopantetheinyl transferase superfamily protein [Prevotella sp.]|nr:4'-phosphopantetheinyl transferase superfamily protein [Prevotella sp.]